ncbi:hypothetical protein OsI_26406 [Oryza sativa Indica Group]|uniref:Uncharacterized protein n=1 Tax=Oryza sativa subsp. indica TaxID=39946 RepID=B8B778_ORYSI|nr:hypothetical protein OsI_26406 [Oryza sativa Indica Group]
MVTTEKKILDEANGLLEARLSAPCYAKYDDGDLAFFDTVVRGNLSFGALRGVEGLSQEELFVWLPVKGIVVADPGSGVILFDIGYAHKRLSRSLFEEPPDCKPSASAGTDAADAARWKDRQGIKSHAKFPSLNLFPFVTGRCSWPEVHGRGIIRSRKPPGPEVKRGVKTRKCNEGEIQTRRQRQLAEPVFPLCKNPVLSSE